LRICDWLIIFVAELLPNWISIFIFKKYFYFWNFYWTSRWVSAYAYAGHTQKI